MTKSGRKEKQPQSYPENRYPVIQKSLDTIDWNILTTMVKPIKIQGRTLKWKENQLSNRTTIC